MDFEILHFCPSRRFLIRVHGLVANGRVPRTHTDAFPSDGTSYHVGWDLPVDFWISPSSEPLYNGSSSAYSSPNTTWKTFLRGKPISLRLIPNITQVELPRECEKDFFMSAFGLSVYSFIISLFVRGHGASNIVYYR